MFQLTRDELGKLVRCKKFTSRFETFFKGQSGGSRYLPYGFTEQGVYMLMTAITEFRDEATKSAFRSVIKNMLGNRELRLR